MIQDYTSDPVSWCCGLTFMMLAQNRSHSVNCPSLIHDIVLAQAEGKPRISSYQLGNLG